MRLIPITRLRHFGVGDEPACLSRGHNVVGALVRDTAGIVPVAVESLSVLAHCLRVRPEHCDLLRARRDARTLSLGASWASHYHNPVDPEDLVRGLCVGQRWLRDHLGGISEDAYLGPVGSGITQMPQILRLSGVRRVALTVAEDIPSRFDWQSPDGTVLPAWNTPGAEQVLEALSQEPGKAKRAVAAVAELFSRSGDLGVGEDGWCPPPDLVDRLVSAGVPNTVICTTLETVYEETASGVRTDWERTCVSAEAVDPIPILRTASISRALLRAEATLTMAACLGKSPESTDALWRRLLELSDGTYGGTSDETKLREMESASASLLGRAKAMADSAETWIAEQVVFGDGPDGTLALVVFNPNPWTATGPVNAHVVFYGEGRVGDFERYDLYRVVDDGGDPIDVEETRGKQVETAEIGFRFVARDVPACGYKTYYLIPKPSRPDALMPIQAPGAMTPEFGEPSFAIEDVEERVSEPRRGIRLSRTFKVRDFRVDVDDVSGAIAIADRSTGTMLIERLGLEVVEDSLASERAEHDPTGRKFELAPDRIDLVESGSVSASLAVEGRLLQSPARLTLTMYGSLPWLDITVAVDWRDEVSGLLQAVFECPTAQPLDIRYATPFGSSVLESPGTRDVHGWVASRNPAWVLASDRRSFRFGAHDVRTDLYLSTIDPSSYTYHRVWRSPAGEITARFRLATNVGEDQIQEADRLAAGLRHAMSLRPVYDAKSQKPLAATASACSVEGRGILSSSIRPVEGGLEIRAYEALGEEGQAILGVPDATAAWEVSPLGEVLREVDATCVRFRPYEIKTIRVDRSKES